MTRLALLLAALAACGTYRNAVASVTPTVPRADGATCPALPWRCTGEVPEHCSVADGVARWWPSNPLGADNRPAACRRCVVEATAHCAPEVTP